MLVSVESRALATLRGLLGDPEATWSSDDQRTAVLTMLQRQADLIALLPTGSGKSMIALIPALMENNITTVLVCPLISLMTDYRRRFDSLRVPYQVFDGGPLQGTANLVIVSADSIKLPDWRHHLCNLHDKRPVARFIFDEAHIPIMDVSYRHTLANMYEMRSFLPVQVGLLSASVPVHAESLLKTTFGIDKSCVFLRSGCNRPEIQYVWKPSYDYGQYVPAVVSAATSFNFLSTDDRGLIYVTSSEVGNIISTKLDIPFYTSHPSVTVQERVTMYHDWLSGKFRFMVCTTAFGAGNDYPRVRIVIHAGTPFEIVPYLQETGRAGRDGKPAVCIMFPGPLRFVGKVDDGTDITGVHAMIDAMRDAPNFCIRAKLTSFIDGIPTSCLSDDANQLCSSCERQALTKEAISSTKRSLNTFETASDYAKRRKLNRELSENEYGQKLKEALDFWVHHCIFCQVIADLLCPTHEIIHCPSLQRLIENEDGVRAYRDFKGLIQYPRPASGSKITICYKCAVPRGLSVDVHPGRFSKDAGGCTYPDIIPPLAFAIYYQDDLRSNASRYFGIKFSDLQTFTRWLVIPASPHPSNSVALFLWYHRYYSHLV
jgi:superfamily II DNA or RNA helicase